MTTALKREESDQPMEEEALIRRSVRSIVCVGELVSRKRGCPASLFMSSSSYPCDSV